MLSLFRVHDLLLNSALKNIYMEQNRIVYTPDTYRWLERYLHETSCSEAKALLAYQGYLPMQSSNRCKFSAAM